MLLFFLHLEPKNKPTSASQGLWKLPLVVFMYIEKITNNSRCDPSKTSQNYPNVIKLDRYDVVPVKGFREIAADGQTY